MEIPTILQEVKKHPTQYVCVTGGEPLGQKGIYPLLESLVENNYVVSLETGGGFSTESVPSEVIKVVDIKCPDSGESKSMVWENLNLMSSKDQFKFVVASQADFQWAAELVREHGLDERCALLISPVKDLVNPRHLAQWVLNSRLPFTFQMQLHKILGVS